MSGAEELPELEFQTNGREALRSLLASERARRLGADGCAEGGDRLTAAALASAADELRRVLRLLFGTDDVERLGQWPDGDIGARRGCVVSGVRETLTVRVVVPGLAPGSDFVLAVRRALEAGGARVEGPREEGDGAGFIVEIDAGPERDDTGPADDDNPSCPDCGAVVSCTALGCGWASERPCRCGQTPGDCTACARGACDERACADSEDDELCEPCMTARDELAEAGTVLP